MGARTTKIRKTARRGLRELMPAGNALDAKASLGLCLCYEVRIGSCRRATLQNSLETDLETLNPKP